MQYPLTKDLEICRISLARFKRHMPWHGTELTSTLESATSQGPLVLARTTADFEHQHSNVNESRKSGMTPDPSLYPRRLLKQARRTQQGHSLFLNGKIHPISGHPGRERPSPPHGHVASLAAAVHLQPHTPRERSLSPLLGDATRSAPAVAHPGGLTLSDASQAHMPYRLRCMPVMNATLEERAALQRSRAAGHPQERLVSRCNTALKPEPCAPRASCAGRTSGRALYAARHGAMTTTAARRLI